MWRASIFTLFPGLFPGPLGTSLAGDALARHVWGCEAIDIRDHGIGRHRAVDDRPAGGGPGMVMRADVVAASLDARLAADDPRPRLVMSPRGRPLTQAAVRTLAEGPGVVIVCGRFEGIDERVIAARNLAEVSIGDYVLSGGEMAALVVLDACVRLLPGVMGAAASGTEESFESGLLEYPHYTRPRDFEGRPIPAMLLGGDHAKIAAWRRAEAERITRERRPDLIGRLPIGHAHRPEDKAGTTARDDLDFSQPFEIDEVGETWISLRHATTGHWWRFTVEETDGRRELVYDAHSSNPAAARSFNRVSIDAYDTAILEASRRGMVD